MKALLAQVQPAGQGEGPDARTTEAAADAHPERVPAPAGRAALGGAGAGLRERERSAARSSEMITRHPSAGERHVARREDEALGAGDAGARRSRACRGGRSRRTRIARRARPWPTASCASGACASSSARWPKPGGDADALAEAAQRALLGARVPAARVGHDGARAPLGGQGARGHRRQGRERRSRAPRVPRVGALRGIDYLVDVWLATDGGRLRLKLFDNEGRPRGCRWCRTTPASQFSGTWHRSEPRDGARLRPRRGRRHGRPTRRSSSSIGDRRRRDGDAPDAAQGVLHGRAPRGVRREHARPGHRADVPRARCRTRASSAFRQKDAQPRRRTWRAAGRSSRTRRTRKPVLKRVGDEAA